MIKYPIPYTLDYDSLISHAKFNKPFEIDETYCKCPGCGDIVRQDKCNPNDPGVCSISCGYNIRGITEPYGWSGR